MRGYLEVFKVKPLRRLILCAFFWGGTDVANNTYFSFLYIDGGGSLAGVRAVMLLMVGSEFPFMAWCERLSRMLTMEKLTAISAGYLCCAFLCIQPWCSRGGCCFSLSFSQGAVNGILLIELVRYAAKLAPENIRSLAIGRGLHHREQSKHHLLSVFRRDAAGSLRCKGCVFVFQYV